MPLLASLARALAAIVSRVHTQHASTSAARGAEYMDALELAVAAVARRSLSGVPAGDVQDDARRMLASSVITSYVRNVALVSKCECRLHALLCRVR